MTKLTKAYHALFEQGVAGLKDTSVHLNQLTHCRKNAFSVQQKENL